MIRNYNPLPAGMRDGNGVWCSDGTWRPDCVTGFPEYGIGRRDEGESIANYNARVVQARLAKGASQEDAYRGLEDAPPGDVAEIPLSGLMWKTHHEPESVEESYSRQMRFDKYLAMQALLNELVNSVPTDARPFLDIMQMKARSILAGMKRPRSPLDRAIERAVELKGLMEAYEAIIAGVDEAHTSDRAITLTVEALKAYERAHPPAPLDPLLLP